MAQSSFFSRNTLPATSEKVWEINFEQDKKMFFRFNLITVPMIIFSAAFILFLIPHARYVFFNIDSFPEILLILISLLVSFAITLFLHEGVHALVYKLFTKNKVEFGFEFARISAYSSCPDTFFSRNAFILNSIAPFLLLNILFFILTALTHGIICFLFMFMFICNFSSCTIDLYYAIRLMRFSKNALISETRAGITVYDRVLQPEVSCSIN